MTDLASLASRLDGARDYFDQRADINEHGGPNEAMRLLADIDHVQAELKRGDNERPSSVSNHG